MAIGDDEYELMPHREIEKLKKEINELHSGPGRTRKNSGLEKSMDQLNDTINSLLEIFKETNMEMRAGDNEINSRLSKLESLNEKLDSVIEQNEKIAEAILTVAESSEAMKNKLDEGLADNIIKRENATETKKTQEEPNKSEEMLPGFDDAFPSTDDNTPDFSSMETGTGQQQPPSFGSPPQQGGMNSMPPPMNAGQQRGMGPPPFNPQQGQQNNMNMPQRPFNPGQMPPPPPSPSMQQQPQQKKKRLFNFK